MTHTPFRRLRDWLIKYDIVIVYIAIILTILTVIQIADFTRRY